MKQAIIVAIVGAFFAAAFTPLGSAVTQGWFSDSDLQLVRVDLDEARKNRKPKKPGGMGSVHDVVKLDVTLRNTGENVAVIDHAVFRVKKIWHLHAMAFPYPLPSTGNYDVRLPPKGAPYRKTREIIRKIPVNDADRFTISMDATRDLYDPDSPLHELTFVYLVNVDLVYDEDNKTVSTGNLLFLRGPLWDGKWYLPRMLEADTKAEAEAEARMFRARNLYIAAEISTTEGKKSEDVKKLVHRLLDEQPDT